MSEMSVGFVSSDIAPQNCEFSWPKSVLTTCFASYGFARAVPRCPEMVSEGLQRVSKGFETFGVFRMREMYDSF